MFKQKFLKIVPLVFILALSFILVKPVYTALETLLSVDASPSTNNAPYNQTHWFGFSATGGKGYCALLSPSSGNPDLYFFDPNFNLAGYSKNSGLTQDKVWYGQAASGPMHIACYGTYNPSSNFTIQVITAPYVNTITPTSGGAGTLVTLTGYGFGSSRGTSYVKFGTVNATSYSSWSNTQIKVYVPTGVASGTIQVVVYVASKASNPMNFTAGVASSDGTMWRYDLARTGNYPNGPTTLPLNLKWNYSLSWHSNSDAPVVANNILYVPIDAYLYAFDANTGSLKWYRYLTGSNPVAIANGVAYMGGSAGGVFYALDTTTAASKWEKRISNNYTEFSSPAVYNSIVYFTAGDNIVEKVYALDANTGNEKWSFSVNPAEEDLSSGSVAIANGIVYVSSDKKVYAFDANTGAQKWAYIRAESMPHVATDILVSNGVVYNVQINYIFALNATTGSLLWSYTAEAYIIPSCAINSNVFYFCSSGDTRKINALDTATRTLKWSYVTSSIRQNDISGPAFSNGIVYVGSYGQLYAIDSTTGVLKWSYSTGNTQFTADPGIWNGKVYISVYGKGVYCFGQ